MVNLFEVSGLSVQYFLGKDRQMLAVDNVSFTIPSTGFSLGLVGESGSGKTTLGMSVMNLIEPPGKITSGFANYLGKNVLEMKPEELRKFRWREVSMVFQSAMNSLNPVKTVADHISEVLREHEVISKSEAHEEAIKLLSHVGIKTERADSYPHEFSGGMRQRVVIAMALALSPKLLIADEPTSALDVVVQKQILTLIKEKVAERGLSLLFITHEIALLRGLVERVAVMFAGEIVEIGPLSKVLYDPLHPYTQMLLGSILSLDVEAPNLATSDRTKEASEAIPIVGCKYAKRCKYVFARCHVEKPVQIETESGRWVACHKYDKN